MVGTVNYWSRAVAGLAFLLLVAVGCSTAVQDTSTLSAQAIATHSGVNFLPPVGTSIALGDFDPNVDMVIKLFERENGSPVGPVFSTDDGTIQVTYDPLVEEQYHVNLDTSLIDVPDATQVRVEVRLANAALGPVCNSDSAALLDCLAFFDLELWPSLGQAKKSGASDDSEDVVIDLVDGGTLPIKVHVKTGASNLVAHWSFDADPCDGTDESGNGHTGTLVNGPACVSGAAGTALDFDGIDDHVVVPNSNALTMTDGFTLTAFITPLGDGNSTYGGIVGNKEGEFEIARYGNDQLAFAIQIAGGPTWGWQHTGITVPLGKQVHFVWTFDSEDGAKIYVHDGTTVQTWENPDLKGIIGDNEPTLNDFWIGGRPLDFDQYFDGVIDEVRLYDRALTAAEADALYASYNISTP